jgi:hypothetical protein
VGRHCLSFPDYREVVAETDTLRQAREGLIATLAAAADSLPGDEWILGQRVRYLLEGARPEEAVAVAKGCQVRRRWWCSALAGYAWHVMADFERAGSAFAAALRAMPEAIRRRWTDISVFLDDPLRGRYLESSPQQRDSLERRFWWLADPLHMTPGNDRRTEHFARNVLVHLLDNAESGYPDIAESRLGEIILRHGWPTGWVRVVQRGDPRTTSVYTPPRRRFVPYPHFILDPTGIQSSEWHAWDTYQYPPRATAAPLETYRPRHLSSISRIEHQVAVFQRGDSVVVVAAYDQSPDWTWLYNDWVDVALILARDELSTPIVRRETRRGARGVLIAKVEAIPWLLSLEVRSRVLRRAARARYGLRLRKSDPLLLAVSDLLLLSQGDSLPASLWRAIPSARGSLRVRPGERLGLYWEVYALSRQTQRLFVSVATYKVAEGSLERLEEVELEENPPIDLSWQEVVPPHTDIWVRAIALDLPRDLSQGLYVIYVTVLSFGREPVQAVRGLYVER